MRNIYCVVELFPKSKMRSQLTPLSFHVTQASKLASFSVAIFDPIGNEAYALVPFRFSWQLAMLAPPSRLAVAVPAESEPSALKVQSCSKVGVHWAVKAAPPRGMVAGTAGLQPAKV